MIRLLELLLFVFASFFVKAQVDTIPAGLNMHVNANLRTDVVTTEKFMLVNGTQGCGKFLMSSENGCAIWAPLDSSRIIAAIQQLLYPGPVLSTSSATNSIVSLNNRIDSISLVVGPTGPTGSNGTNGIQGNTGPTGIQGATGYMGNVDNTGATGLTGATGNNGSIGLIGPTGAMGVQGITGANGNNGTTGGIGPQGATGPTGSTGLLGNTGPTGNAGATGFNGATGATGSAGIIGATGVQGIQGSTGTAGSTGATGTQGLQGITGTAGTNGVTGATGVGAIYYDRVQGSAPTTYIAINYTSRLLTTASGIVNDTVTTTGTIAGTALFPTKITSVQLSAKYGSSLVAIPVQAYTIGAGNKTISVNVGLINLLSIVVAVGAGQEISINAIGY